MFASGNLEDRLCFLILFDACESTPDKARKGTCATLHPYTRWLSVDSTIRDQAHPELQFQGQGRIYAVDEKIVLCRLAAGRDCLCTFGGLRLGRLAATPALIVLELSGQTFVLAKQRSKVVVSFGRLDALRAVPKYGRWTPYRRYRDQGLVMLGLSTDRAHDRGEAVKMAQKTSYPGAILIDAQTNDFGSSSSFPLTIVIDRTGLLRFESTEDRTPVTQAQLEAAVARLLADRQGGQMRIQLEILDHKLGAVDGNWRRYCNHWVRNTKAAGRVKSGRGW